MNNLQKNKALVIKYFNGISGVVKTPELCKQFMTDQKLIDHISFIDSIFPRYELFAEEMVAEGDKVMVRARITGQHEGEFNGIPATHKRIDFPFAISYTFRNGKIVDHWMVADQMIMMEQLGLAGTTAPERIPDPAWE